MSQAGNPEWPPRSPHEVLLSTPRGRDRLRRLAERASPSPSPIKRTLSTSALRDKGKDLMGAEMDGDSDEDEETLQLQLQEIQARLKLKKLQKKSKQSSDTENEGRFSAPLTRSNSAAANRAQSRLAGLQEERLERSKSQANIHVPVSPIRRAQPAEPHRSPKRVILGIDKGLTGRDISLKRAPSLRKRDDADIQDRKLGPFLQRPVSQAAGRASSVASSSQSEDKPKSFSERMAASRAQEADRLERELRIKKKRSNAFDIDHEKMEQFKEKAVEFPEAPRAPTSFSREDILNSYNAPIASSGLSRSKTAPDLRSAIRSTSNTTQNTSTLSNRSESRASVDVPPGNRASAKSKVPPSEVSEAEASQFEPFSATHLSKRIIPHQVLTRTLTGKKTFLLPDLLRTVKGPDFSGPDIEEDVVVFGIIARKTDPRAHQPNTNSKADKRGKYMIMGLTDLKWELDLFLFDSAFDKFWKLTPGTLIAILNPSFMPPPRGKADTGKFSIVLNSDADTILEIGSARDLGFCKSTLEKTHAKRMEVNTMNFGKGEYGNKRKFNSRDAAGKLERNREAKMNEKTRYDRESHSQIFISKKSTSSMLDDVDFDPDAFHRGSTKEERMTRRILAQEKERELAKKLQQMGGGLGADYMRAKYTSKDGPSYSHPEDQDEPAPPDAASLGLLSGKARDVALSPIKRKRANTTSSSAARGWGSDLSKELGRMKNGESLQPVKKKTRFVTEKGIREAGRESIGGDAAKAVLNDLDDDDDDDLDIVRE
ncbi:hypothetical protein G7Y89_g233 [Cudoniella acicularis]|uniref:MCM10 OB-fold domain-containing protein n=1 Tax=Cudoniella acicularis TaxID=354080 RepID=A0A8H4RYK2_9HELO|nr:hypothetical protein G7Y89_g233 [Cudoniella acicularis]